MQEWTQGVQEAAKYWDGKIYYQDRFVQILMVWSGYESWGATARLVVPEKYLNTNTQNIKYKIQIQILVPWIYLNTNTNTSKSI